MFNAYSCLLSGPIYFAHLSIFLKKCLYKYILTNAGFDIFMAIDTTQSFPKAY